MTVERRELEGFIREFATNPWALNGPGWISAAAELVRRMDEDAEDAPPAEGDGPEGDHLS